MMSWLREHEREVYGAGAIAGVFVLVGLAGFLVGVDLGHRRGVASVKSTTCPAQKKETVTVEKLVPAKTATAQVDRNQEKTVTRYDCPGGKPSVVVEYRNRDVIHREVVTQPGKETVRVETLVNPMPPPTNVPPRPDWLLGAAGGRGLTGDYAGRVELQRRIVGPVYGSVSVDTTGRAWLGASVAW